jgi:GNAT superfamily N-acetyltransferase
MPEVVISRLTESSASAVEQLNALLPQLKPGWDPITPASLTSVLDSPTHVYVARIDDEIIGVALIVPHHHFPGVRCHVEDVVVDERVRRKGVARALLTMAMADAPEGTLSFDLRSHRFRRPAHALYLSLGFEESDSTIFRKMV